MTSSSGFRSSSSRLSLILRGMCSSKSLLSLELVASELLDPPGSDENGLESPVELDSVAELLLKPDSEL